MQSRDRLGDGREGLVDLAVELQAVVEDLHLQQPALVLAPQDGARRRQAGVPLVVQRPGPGPCLVGARPDGDFPGRVEPQVGVVGQFGGTLLCPLGQVALGQRLQPSGDALDEPRLVVGVGRLAEQLGVTLAELAGAEPLQGRHLPFDVPSHAYLLSESPRVVNSWGQ